MSEAVKTRTAAGPSSIALHAREGWGKTSWAAQFPAPIFLMTARETGLLTLVENGLLPETPHLPMCNTWAEMLDGVKALIEQEHPYKTLVIDTLNGAERLCHEHVCNRDYGGDWGEKGFTSYMRGFEVSLGDWRELLDLLDQLRTKRNVRPLLLIHTKVVTFKNPTGADFDKYQPEMHAKTWALTAKWLDAILFGNFEAPLLDEKVTAKKTKALNGMIRMLYTEAQGGWDAKNRFGLPAEIECGESAAEAYKAFMDSIKTARQANSGVKQ